jgi:hypothetical protein
MNKENELVLEAYKKILKKKLVKEDTKPGPIITEMLLKEINSGRNEKLTKETLISYLNDIVNALSSLSILMDEDIFSEEFVNSSNAYDTVGQDIEDIVSTIE